MFDENLLDFAQLKTTGKIHIKNNHSFTQS